VSDARNVVLVHGGFVDGSGWEGVYRLLKQQGFNVSVVQNPTRTLEEDVAFTRRVLDQQDGPAILVGHSYGGVVVTEAGNHDKVAALVYITAFAPDQGESVGSLIADPPPGAPVPPILPPQDGFLFLDREKFAASFAADVSPELAAFMADSQVPWGLVALNGAVSEPAWRSKPSWYLVVTDDHMIPPPAQRAMSERAGATITETPGSHAVYVSNPAAVTSLITQAARSGVPEGALA
jgi:pimeloyl-ACP methyl ester carboxylesterase